MAAKNRAKMTNGQSPVSLRRYHQSRMGTSSATQEAIATANRVARDGHIATRRLSAAEANVVATDSSRYIATTLIAVLSSTKMTTMPIAIFIISHRVNAFRMDTARRELTN